MRNQVLRYGCNLIQRMLTFMGSMSLSGGTTTGCEPLVGFEMAVGAFFVVVESDSSPSLIAVLVTFRVAVFFTGAGGSLGFIAAVLVVRVAIAGFGSVGVVVFERVALAFVAVEVVGFGMRGAILCTRLRCWVSGPLMVSITTRRVPRRSRSSGHPHILRLNAQRPKLNFSWLFNI